jgi:hypothetical protein
VEGRPVRQWRRGRRPGRLEAEDSGWRNLDGRKFVEAEEIATGSGRTLYNHFNTSVGLMSSSDPRVHFGLGKGRSIAGIEIRWPSGTIQRLENIRVNQILRIDEPKAK